MIRNFFINAIRNMRKQSGYILLNVGGLAIGLTSFLFISLYVIDELSYDRFHKNYENIYSLKVVGRLAGGVLDQAVTAAPMAQAMLNDYPEILEATRVTGMGDWLIKFGDKKFNEDGILFADSTFFKVLDFKLLKGDPTTALVQPRSIILTEEYAHKYFGSQDPMGLKVSVEADSILYTVTGVVQNVPDNSHIKFDMLASMSTYPGRANNQNWVSHNFYTYIIVRDGTGRTELQGKLQEMVIKYVGPQLQEILGYSIDDFRKAGNDFSYVLEPLKEMHLKGATQYNFEPLGSLATVYIFAVIAVLILVIAIINYVNLATAKSAGRAKEGLLVIFQFTVSIVIIIGSIIVYNQLNFMTKKDLGFEKDNLIIIHRADAFYRQFEAFRDQLLQMPGVDNVGFSRQVPGTNFSNNAFFNDDDPEKQTYLLQQAQVSFDFPRTLGVHLADGRFFSREFSTDSTAVLINEAAVKSLGLTDPVGKFILQPRGPQQFRRLRIIGVMKDFYITSMHKAIDPVCFTVLGRSGGDQYASVRLTGNNVNETIKEIEQK